MNSRELETWADHILGLDEPRKNGRPFKNAPVKIYTEKEIMNGNVRDRRNSMLKSYHGMVDVGMDRDGRYQFLNPGSGMKKSNNRKPPKD